MRAARIRELLKDPTEENCRLILEILRSGPKDTNKPLPVRLAEANQRMAEGECFDLDEVIDILNKLDRFGLTAPSSSSGHE